MCIHTQFSPYVIPAVWYPAQPPCHCAWGCHYGCQCYRCHFQPPPGITCTPSTMEAKLDRLLVLAERGEAERKRQAAVNKKKSHRW